MYKYPNIDKLLSRRTFLLGIGKGVLFSVSKKQGKSVYAGDWIRG